MTDYEHPLQPTLSPFCQAPGLGSDLGDAGRIQNLVQIQTFIELKK